MTAPRTHAVRDEVLVHRFPEATWTRPIQCRWLDKEHGAVTLFGCPFCMYRQGLRRENLSDTSWLVWLHLYDEHSVPICPRDTDDVRGPDDALGGL